MNTIKSKRIISFSLIALILAFSAVTVYLCFFSRVHAPASIGQHPVYVKGIITADGRTQNFSSDNYDFAKDSYKNIIISGFFSEDISESDTLLIYASDVSVEIACGDKTLYSSLDGTISGIDGSYKNIWLMAETGHIAEDDAVTIKISANGEEFSPSVAKDIFSSLSCINRFGLYSGFFTGLVVPLALYILIVVICVFVFSFSFITKNRGAEYRTGVLLFIMIMCGWEIVFDSKIQYFSLMVSQIQAVYFGRLFPLLTVASLLPVYIMACSSERRRYMFAVISSALSGSAAVFSMIMLLLNLTDLDKMTWLTLVMLLSITVNLIMLYLDERRRNDGMYRLVCACPICIGTILNCTAILKGATIHLYGFSLGFLLTVILRAVLSYRDFVPDIKRVFNSKKTETELEQSRITIMLSQIRPHFLFNSLTAIKQLCITDPSKAEEAIDRFSGFLRRNLDSVNRTEMIPFQTELDFLSNYLYLEQMRVGKRLRVEYDIESDTFMLPALTVQPIVENAVRYGIAKKPDGGTVNIITRELETAYLIIVSDDGVGFDPEVRKNDGRSHVGIDNVRSRLNYQCSGTLTIKSRPGEGTAATIMIPKQQTGGKQI